MGLRQDLMQVFGPAMEDPKALEVKVIVENEKSGLLISYPISPKTAARERSFQFHRRRLVNLIYGRSFWKRKAIFITLKIRLPDGKVHEETFPNPGPSK